MSEGQILAIGLLTILGAAVLGKAPWETRTNRRRSKGGRSRRGSGKSK